MGKETLVLLPGMMCDARLFAPQIEALAPNYDVVVVDLTDGDTIQGLARRVLGNIGTKPFNLAGLSMGGIVAMAVVGMAGMQVKRLALLDTNHRADTIERQALRDAQTDSVIAGNLHTVVVKEMKPHYLAEPNRRNQALLDLLIDMALDLGADVFLKQTRALRDRPDQSAALQVYDGPALVLCGEQDALCPLERHHEMAALLNDGELVVVPDAGHITTLENPKAVNAALQQWLLRPIEAER